METYGQSVIAPAQAVPAPQLQIERWPTEIPLRILLILTSIGIWIALTVTIIGLVYALLLMVFFFLAHVGFTGTRRACFTSGADSSHRVHPHCHAFASGRHRLGSVEALP